MNKREARARVRQHLIRHAPELLSILFVAWCPIPEEFGAQAVAFLHATHQVPLDAADGAILIFDAARWRALDAAARAELVDHETAHLIAGAKAHARSLDAHDDEWHLWYGRLRSGE